MIVSDLHLEKESSQTVIKRFLQPNDTQDTLSRLEKSAEDLKPKKIIILGDIFHDGEGFNRISLDDMDQLYGFFKKHNIVWVEGHHNGGFSPPNVDMRIEYAYLNLNFRYIATDNEDFEISGHYHPEVFTERNNIKQHQRCFIHDKTKLVLPSFTTNHMGQDISDPAIQTLFKKNVKIYPIGKNKVYG